MSAEQFDKDLLATLTPEEQAAITGAETYSEQEIATMRRLAGGDAADAGKAATDAADDGADDAADGDDDAEGQVLDADGNPVAPQGDGKAADDGAGKADAPADDAAAPAAAAAPAPVVYDASLPADFEQQVKDVQAQADALRKQFKDGEIDLEQFDEANAKLQEQRDALATMRAKAETMSALNQQNAEAAWRNTVTTFFSTIKAAGGPDYTQDEAKRNDLDMFVKALANNAANEGKPMDWFLQEAHRRTAALHGLQAPAAGDAGKGKGDGKEGDPSARRKPNLSVVPKTLAHVPGGDGPGDVGGDEFANIDALEGEALEDAIARMSPAQRQKYVMGR